MTRLTALVALVMTCSLFSTSSAAQGAPVLSGTVLTATGTPVADASVVILRRGRTGLGGENLSILAQGRTNASGRFSFGPVALESQVEFPVETSVAFTYEVHKAGLTLIVNRVTFEAQRRDQQIVSVEANVEVR